MWRFLKKLEIELPYDPAIPLLSIYPKVTISVSQRDLRYCHVHYSITHNSQDMETTQKTISEWIDKVVFMHSGMLFSHEKGRYSSICYNIMLRCFLVAQLLKNPPAMQETLVQFLGQEIPWRRNRLPTPVYSWASRVPQLVKNPPWTQLSKFHFQSKNKKKLL